MGAFPFQVTISGVAIPMTPFFVPRPERDEPVYIWRVPDRQCVGRVTSRDRLPFQPKESITCAFEWIDVLDNNGATIDSILYIEQAEGYVVAGSERIEGSQVRFTVTIPEGEPETDTGIECSIQDSKGNRHVADGILYVTHGDA